MQTSLFTDYTKFPSYWIRAKEGARHVPAYPAVYIITEANGSVKYVGQTMNMQQRYRDHKQKLLRNSELIGWLRCDESELLFYESWYIATLRPWANMNQGKIASKVREKTSVALGVVARNIWKKGAEIEVITSQSRLFSRIMKVDGDLVYVGEQPAKTWFHSPYKKMYVRVLLE